MVPGPPLPNDSTPTEPWRPQIAVRIPSDSQIADTVLFRKGDPFVGPDGKLRYPLVQFSARIERPRVAVRIPVPAFRAIPAETYQRWARIQAYASRLEANAFFILRESVPTLATKLPPDALVVPAEDDTLYDQAVALLTAIDCGLAGRIVKDAGSPADRIHRVDHRPLNLRFCLSHHNDFSAWAERCAEALILLGVPYARHSRRFRADWTPKQYHEISPQGRISLFRDMCDELRRASLGEFH